TSMTAKPASRRAFAVPPVESRVTPCRVSARASSTRPVLSETESSARRTRTCNVRSVSAVGEAELPQLLAQRAPVDAEDFRGPALVALRVFQHGLEQRFLDLAQHHAVELRGPVPVQAREVGMESFLSVTAQRHFLAVGSRNILPASPALLLCWHVVFPR